MLRKRLKGCLKLAVSPELLLFRVVAGRLSLTCKRLHFGLPTSSHFLSPAEIDLSIIPFSTPLTHLICLNYFCIQPHDGC
jgi:hypothetical protein